MQTAEEIEKDVPLIAAGASPRTKPDDPAAPPSTPSPGTPGEGRGEGSDEDLGQDNPSPTRQEISNLALTGAPDQDIADLLGISLDDLRSKFSNDLLKARAKFRISLRRKQFSAALADKGNPSLLIFLGKYELGQTDRQENGPRFDSEPLLDPKVG